jgi:hypothetical protein
VAITINNYQLTINQGCGGGGGGDGAPGGAGGGPGGWACGPGAQLATKAIHMIAMIIFFIIN